MPWSRKESISAVRCARRSLVASSHLASCSWYAISSGPIFAGKSAVSLMLAKNDCSWKYSFCEILSNLWLWHRAQPTVWARNTAPTVSVMSVVIWYFRSIRSREL